MPHRKIQRTHAAHTQLEGAGVAVRRPFPSRDLDLLDPFLLLDEGLPMELLPGEAKGVPSHPHRGFETVSYILEGEVQHRDSTGHSGLLRSGDVQWMTAGRGIVHSEMPSDAMLQQGGRMHLFQLWVNLPSSHKSMDPRYQDRRAADLPTATSDDGLARVVVIAGRALGVEARIETVTPILYQHWTLQPGASVIQPGPSDYNLGVYVCRGAGETGGASLAEGELGVYGEGDAVALSVPEDAAGPAELLLLGGRPIGEPIARYGPFVMNHRDEIQQAILDYRMGRMGRIEAEPR